MELQSSEWMQLPFCRDVGGMSFLRGGERAQVAAPSFQRDRRDELAPRFKGPQNSCAVVSACVSLILKLLRSRNLTKVVHSVVSAIAVNVVKFFFRPLSMNPQPRQAVGFSTNPADLYSNVSKITNRSSCHSWAPSSRALQPGKYPCLRVIMEDFAQPLCGNFFGGHMSCNSNIAC